MRWKDKTQVVSRIFCILSILLRFYQSRIYAGLHCLHSYCSLRSDIPFAATSSMKTQAVLVWTLASPLTDMPFDDIVSIAETI